MRRSYCSLVLLQAASREQQEELLQPRRVSRLNPPRPVSNPSPAPALALAAAHALLLTKISQKSNTIKKDKSDTTSATTASVAPEN